MMRRILIVTAVIGLLAFTQSAVAQTGVSVNTTGAAPDANAILDISSPDKGVLFPRVADHTSISPTLGLDDGLMVFDTGTDSYWYWDASINDWREIVNQDDLDNIVVSLQEAYDGGQTINANAGNVAISGAGFLTVASNIGVGTTAPSEKLELEFSGRGGILLDGDDTQDAFIQFDNDGVSNYIYTDQSDNNNLKLESGTGKSVNILTDGANERLVVQSDGRIRVNNLAEPNGAVVTSNAAGVLAKTPLTNDANDVLLGTGVFGPASDFADDDWYQVLSTNTPTGITDWIYTNGRVGIGVGASSNPEAPLHVAASGFGNPGSNSITALNPNNSVGNDAIISARVGGANAGDPFFSLDISGEAGWSMGIDNDDDNRFKIAPSWSNLSAGTALTIQTDGNVGVGTTGPTERLTITGSNNDTYPALGLQSGNNNNGFNNGAQISFGYNGTSNYQHFIQTRHNSSAAQNAIDFYVSNGTQNNTLTSGTIHNLSLVSGSVGVGTTAPNATLNVIHPTSNTSPATPGGNWAALIENRQDASDSRNGLSVAARWGGAETTIFEAASYWNGSSEVYTPVLTVKGNRFVGIGTASPNQKLEVAGNTRITGLGGGGDRVVYTNNNGDLYASTGLPANDTDYIWNQNGSAQGANWRISGQGEANTLVANASGNWYLRGGDDHELRDVNIANTMGVWGRQNSDRGGIQLGSDGSYIFGDNGNIGVGNTGPVFKLHVSGDIHPDGFLVVQNGVDGGSSRGIRMWTQGDSNWGIYMGQSGGGRSFSGGTATAGGGFSQHAIRFRVANSSSQGFIFENSAEQNLFSIRGNNGRATFRGGIVLDCVGCGSTSSIDGDGSSNWGTLAIQGRVLSANSNIHLSPPGGNGVIINSTYRSAGGGTGETYLDVDGRVDARGGLRSDRQIRFYKRSRGNGQGGVDNLGNYDFCYLSGVAFRNSNSNIDEDDDYQCNVYTQDINGSAEYNEGENEDFTRNFDYTTRPYWRMYSECYQDCSNSTCTAMCINFDF